MSEKRRYYNEVCLFGKMEFYPSVFVRDELSITLDDDIFLLISQNVEYKP